MFSHRLVYDENTGSVFSYKLRYIVTGTRILSRKAESQYYTYFSCDTDPQTIDAKYELWLYTNSQTPDLFIHVSFQIPGEHTYHATNWMLITYSIPNTESNYLLFTLSSLSQQVHMVVHEWSEAHGDEVSHLPDNINDVPTLRRDRHDVTRKT